MSPAVYPPTRRGDRIRVLQWGSEAITHYAGLEGTVRSVSEQGVVVVDLDKDPMRGRDFKRIGLVFDPAFLYDNYEVIGRPDRDFD